jgi:hypothetical protein
MSIAGNQPEYQSAVTDISSLANEYKQLEGRISDINKCVADLKSKMGYKEVSQRLKPIKQALYMYMSSQKLKDLGGIKLSKVKPTEVKTMEREVRLTDKISDVVGREIDDADTADELTASLVEAVIAKR